MRGLLPALILLLGACGPTDTSLGDGGTTGSDGGGGGGADAAIAADAPPDTGCTMTFSGDVVASQPCTAAAGKMASDDFSIITATTTGSTPLVSSAAWSVFVAGTVSVRDYAPAQLQNAALMLTTADNRIYVASLGSGTPQGTVGTLRLTALEPKSSDTQTQIWAPHGTFNATLVGTAAGGSITLTVTF